MQVQIEAISTKTSEIAKNIQTVDDTLTEKKKRIQKLSNAQIAIKKLNFIFELPKKLEANLNRNQIAKAIIYSTRATHLLSKYTHLSAFQKIEKDCEMISKQITKLIEKKLDESVIMNTLCCRILYKTYQKL